MPRVPRLKVVLLGDEAVGKTSLHNTWSKRPFDPNQIPTIGGFAAVVPVDLDDQQYDLHIWDTAGAERFRSLTPIYVRDCVAAAIVFDLSRRSTFDSLAQWITFLRQHQSNVAFIIVGNKEDLTDKQEVAAEEARAFAHSIDSQFFTTSAFTGSNVEMAFMQLQIEAVNAYKQAAPSISPVPVPLEPSNDFSRIDDCC
jgi:small GTP-binding protein